MAQKVRIVERCLVLDQPSFDAGTVAEVDQGTALDLLGEDDRDFYRVAHEGRPGFVAKRYAMKLVETGVPIATPTAGQRTQCPSCGGDAPAGAAICPSCGRDLPRAGRCPSCGAGMAAGDQFCGSCGRALAAPAGLTRQWDEARDYAGFWGRFGALFLDGIIVGVVTLIVSFALLAADDSGVLGWLVSIALGAIYYSVGNGTGATLGKRAFGLRVIKDSDGSVPGLGSGFLRWFISLFSALVLYLGYLWMIWDPKKQTWHDKAAGTVVVKAE
jgi:uncharacterized RDD family membrane protein YckC